MYFFPTKFTCVNVSWFNNDYLKLSEQIELINKSYSVARNITHQDEYLSNFTWFPFWLKRNYTEIFRAYFNNHFTRFIFCFFFLKKKNI